MNVLAFLLLVLASLVLLTALALYLYTLPGLRLLPKEGRTSLAGVTTLADAVAACRRTGLRGWDLVAYAQDLAAHKFSYSRRNPWDSPARAFERGMGYCQQQALAEHSFCCEQAVNLSKRIRAYGGRRRPSMQSKAYPELHFRII